MRNLFLTLRFVMSEMVFIHETLLESSTFNGNPIQL